MFYFIKISVKVFHIQEEYQQVFEKQVFLEFWDLTLIWVGENITPPSWFCINNSETVKAWQM